MNDSEKNSDDPMRKMLQERFDAFEPDVPQSLAERIFGTSPSRRSVVDWSISAVLLFLTGWFLLLRMNHLVDKSSGLSWLEKPVIKAASDRKRVSEMVIRSASVKAPELASKKHPVAHYTERTKDYVSLDRTVPGRSEKSVRKLNHRVARAGASQSYTRSATHLVKATPPLEQTSHLGQSDGYTATNFDSVATEAVAAIPLISSLPIRLLNVSLKQPMVSPLPVQSPMSAPKHRSAWLLTVTPMQTFQLVTLRSSPAWPISDVRFGSPLSWESKGIKVSAGIEKNKVQFLMNYTFVPTTLSYRQAIEEFTVPTVASDHFEVTQSTTPRTLKDNLHWLSAGVRKTTAFRINQTVYNGSVGVEFGWTLPTGQAIAMANLGFTKEVKLVGKTTLVIGPYAEFDLLKRTIVPEVWQSRTYRVGVTIGMNHPRK